MHEIVAAKIGSIITATPGHIIAAMESGIDCEWISRWQMKAMACADLGPRWGEFANAKTLFRVDEYGKIHAPEVGRVK